MSRSNKRSFKEASLGILTAILLWIIGHLLSGKLAFVEDIQLYNTGFFVFLFPVVLFVSCVLIAKKAAQNGAKTYFKALMISVFVPIISGFLAMVLESIHSFITDYINLIPILLSVPFASIFLRMLECLDASIGELPETLIIVSIFLVPMILALIVSVRVYKKYS